MQETLSRTLMFEASIITLITEEEVAKTDTSFLAYGA